MGKIFKAMRLDTGEWVICALDDVCCMYSKKNGEPLEVYQGKNNKSDLWVEIDKDTICQYTGINDSEGNRIFEGDEFDDGSYVKMYSGRWVVDCYCELCYLHDAGEDLTLTGHNIHDRG